MTALLKRRLAKSGQKIVEAAATEYRAGPYNGKVLLLLAADRAPHADFLSGRQALILDDLHIEYIDCHHSEL